ncbi:MAG: ATP-binding protein [Thermodesulfobacteriota bacterium]
MDRRSLSGKYLPVLRPAVFIKKTDRAFSFWPGRHCAGTTDCYVFLGQIFPACFVEGSGLTPEQDRPITYNNSSPRRLKIGCGLAAGEDISYYVKDNGPGIAPEYHDDVFQLFKRRHANREYPGSGAGLAIGKRALERLGATWKLMASPGQGAAIKFTLAASNRSNSVLSKEKP